MKLKLTAKTEVILWTSCMTFGAAVLFFELSVANARADRQAVRPAPAIEFSAIPAAPTLAPPALGERRRERVSDLLVFAIVQVESSGDARMVGSSGERGLMQVKRDTWAEVSSSVFGNRVSFDRAFDPNMNRRIGKAYLAYLHRYLAKHRANWRGDERSLLLACYNAGPGRVKEAGFAVKNLPASTRDYVKRASALHDYYLGQCEVDISGLLVSQVAPRSSDS